MPISAIASSRSFTTWATVVALDAGDDRLGGLAHERMVVTGTGLAIPAGLGTGFEPDPGDDTGVPADVLAGLHLPASFDLAQHFVSAAAGLDPDDRLGWRARLGHVLGVISGQTATPGRARRAG